MGGYGAMMFAAHHPDLFAAAASLSGAVDSNPPADAAAISASSSADGAPPDSIYGPRADQEVRWHGHNPVDLAGNLGAVDLQLRTADGTLDPAIGETLGDGYSCLIENGIYHANIDLHQQLLTFGIPHVWTVYSGGCHSVPNFEREIKDSLPGIARVFAHPAPAPTSFSYISIQPHFDIWGWHIDTDPARALEFLAIHNASVAGLTLAGSGNTTVTTPPLFRGLRHVDLRGATPSVARPDSTGRIRFTVDLGRADQHQQYTIGATTTTTSRTVTFAPHATVVITQTRADRRGLRVCARAIGGPVTARLRLVDRHRHAATRAIDMTLATTPTCLRSSRLRPPSPGRYTLTIAGRDSFGHTVTASRTITIGHLARRQRRRLSERPGQ